MAAYYNYGGGCIAGHCTVQMKNGTKKVSEIVKGDELACGRVVCVLKTRVGKVIEMINYGAGLLITPYHPIKVNGEWVFPESVGTKSKVFLSEYYNFVLEGGHSLKVNGVECISLGHNLTENSVVSHDYLGTDKVIEDLKSMKGWSSGEV